jgi:bifunctional ADP-heptose synthase (sugar kinase/adenylyltransferase)
MDKKKGKFMVADSKGKIVEYKGVNLIAPNRVELCNAYDEKPTNNDAKISELARKLAKEMECSVVVKRSEKGVLLVSKGEENNYPSTAKKIVNVSGAGDVFVAAIAATIASGKTISEAVKVANHAAGIAIGRTRPHVTLDDLHDFE